MRVMGKLRVYASHRTTYPQIKVLPDLTVAVKRRSVAVKFWRVSLAAMYTAKPVIPEAFRPECVHRADDPKRKPVDQELFDRTAPRWNCVDYPEGMHYMSDGRCLWCERTGGNGG